MNKHKIRKLFFYLIILFLILLFIFFFTLRKKEIIIFYNQENFSTNSQIFVEDTLRFVNDTNLSIYILKTTDSKINRKINNSINQLQKEVPSNKNDHFVIDYDFRNDDYIIYHLYKINTKKTKILNTIPESKVYEKESIQSIKIPIE